LDWLIARKTANRTQKPALQDLLRLGLYQIFWLDRIPNHAAVHVTVELAKQRGLGPQSGFVNALLRGYLREFDTAKSLLAELKTSQPALGFSHPEWLVSRWEQRWGAEKTRQLLEWNNTPPKTFARVNTLKADPAKLIEQWRDENVEYDFVRKDWFEENLVFELKSHPSLGTLPSFQQGQFYIQDPSTLLAVQMLDPQAGETILDLCAAPGGKLTYIAQRVGNQGRIVAHDIRPDRLALIHENCARLGVTCAQAASPESLNPQLLFDRILVDAPCSNTGVMRRRVGLRWSLGPHEIGRLAGSQDQLLRKAATLLNKNGILLYSTCSIEPQENQEVVKSFLAAHPRFKLTAEREVLPFTDGVDGAYVARIEQD
jgi:16S rRNA (cytosine967-C5)-methyltransferase